MNDRIKDARVSVAIKSVMLSMSIESRFGAREIVYSQIERKALNLRCRPRMDIVG
jgi:hypothetical protein